MLPHVVLPTPANLRFYNRLIACSLIIAVCSLATALALLHFDTNRSGRSPYALLFSSVGFVGAIVMFRGVAETLRQQIRRLQSHGRRYAAEHVRTARMRRGQLTHWNVVVATWRDEQGQLHEALSDSFHYDPAALLDRSRLTVLADPFEPALAMVLPDGLPPARRWRLSPQQRAEVEAQNPTHPMLTLVWAFSILFVIAMLSYIAVLIYRVVQD